MDCCLCEQSAHLFRARNSLCARCFEGAKEIIEFSSRLDCVLLSEPYGRSAQLLLEFASTDDAENVRYRPDSHGFQVVSGSSGCGPLPEFHQSASNANHSSSSSSSKQNHAIKPENLSSSSSSSSASASASSSRRTYSTSRLPSPSNSISKSLASSTTPRTKGLGEAVKRIKQLEQAVVMASKQISYLSGLGDSFIEALHTDLELISEEGLSLKAHRVILAARSSVFRTMLEMEGSVSDVQCKSMRIQIPETTYVELKYLVEFMYYGTLKAEALQDHALKLIQAADKYDIPLLVDMCEGHLVDNMSAKNALEVLEVSTRLSSSTDLKQGAMNTILLNYESLMYCREYEEFAIKNPLLALQVSQYVLEQLKPRILPKYTHAM